MLSGTVVSSGLLWAALVFQGGGAELPNGRDVPGSDLDAADSAAESSSGSIGNPSLRRLPSTDSLFEPGRGSVFAEDVFEERFDFIRELEEQGDVGLGSLALQLGAMDFDDSNTAFQGGVEYRFRALGYGVRPALGVSGTMDGSVYAYGGLRWEVPLIAGFVFAPSFAVAAYEAGDGLELGGVLEFRSGVELSYRFAGGSSIGIGASHLSHAGLNGGRNPGADAVFLSYTVDF